MVCLWIVFVDGWARQMSQTVRLMHRLIQRQWQPVRRLDISKITGEDS